MSRRGFLKKAGTVAGIGLLFPSALFARNYKLARKTPFVRSSHKSKIRLDQGEHINALYNIRFEKNLTYLKYKELVENAVSEAKELGLGPNHDPESFAFVKLAEYQLKSYIKYGGPIQYKDYVLNKISEFFKSEKSKAFANKIKETKYEVGGLVLLDKNRSPDVIFIEELADHLIDYAFKNSEIAEKRSDAIKVIHYEYITTMVGVQMEEMYYHINNELIPEARRMSNKQFAESLIVALNELSDLHKPFITKNINSTLSNWQQLAARKKQFLKYRLSACYYEVPFEKKFEVLNKQLNVGMIPLIDFHIHPNSEHFEHEFVSQKSKETLDLVFKSDYARDLSSEIDYDLKNSLHTAETVFAFSETTKKFQACILVLGKSYCMGL